LGPRGLRKSLAMEPTERCHHRKHWHNLCAFHLVSTQSRNRGTSESFNGSITDHLIIHREGPRRKGNNIQLVKARPHTPHTTAAHHFRHRQGGEGGAGLQRRKSQSEYRHKGTHGRRRRGGVSG
jgi:hypothetical protein